MEEIIRKKYKCICKRKTYEKYCCSYHNYVASRSYIGETVSKWEKRRSGEVVKTTKDRLGYSS
jgi:hypothetical protein